jgi:hypothetical protein
MFQLAACLSDFYDRSDEPIAMITVAIGAAPQGARRVITGSLVIERQHREHVEGRISH